MTSGSIPSKAEELLNLDPGKGYHLVDPAGFAIRYYFHYASAAVFLLSLAFMSLFLFTKSDKPVSKRTKGK